MRTFPLLLVLVTACHHKPAPIAPLAATADPNDPLRFMPPTSEVIVGVDLVQLRTSPLWAQVAPRISGYGSRILEPFQHTCGWDPVATASTLTMGVQNLALAQPDATLVVRGIDRERFLACAKNASASGVPISVDANTANVPGVLAAVFVEPTLAVIQIGPNSSPESVQRVIAAGAPLRATPPQVQTSGAAWIVAQGDARILTAAQNLAGKPKLLTGSLRVLGDLSLAGRVQFPAADAAEEFAKRVRATFALTSGMMQRSSVTVTGNDALIELVATYPEASRIVDAAVPMPGPTPPPADTAPAESPPTRIPTTR